ncbi:MAG: N-6 DNA methylase [Deltaproteobacteria bacterium]|nr:N-6 DNA methylase [Deltaproteobacteria bacterium]
MEDAKEKTKELVERFHRNLDAYKSGSYNETQLRREFIDPFFEALGWDVQNKQGYAEQYKEVVHEDSIKVGISLKAPDYSFRIGGQRKFFLETKKPAINIKEDTSPAYQLRRYAWSAKLPLSILTDFEEFAVYDCRITPNPSDKVSTGRIAYYTYEQYIGKFDEIYDRFSKEAVLKGSFDRYIETTKGMRGTAEVDKEFLRAIESWREILAKNLAQRNPRLTVDELNFAVQQTIDRIIFLRICEDRGIESYGRLQALLNGVNTYRRLMELFYQADAKYNSGLFDFKADTLSHTLVIDDKALKDIVEGLYYPKSPYEFSVLGAEILGNVYEQFLGKVIRLTAGHAAKVEEKPEVKKAGGVYYTPSYIVDYIVKNTVGKLLEVKTPKQAEKLRILDPACGSGSFLIGAYQHLLDWHTKWYNKNNPEKYATGKKPAVYRSRAGWQLTTTEKKRILLNNIYGVDIDRQAVEVTKLSLLLKVLEGENEETLGKTLALFRERALPDLKDNIKCGNSLIGPDFYDSISPTLPFIPSRQGRGKAPSPLAPDRFNRGLAGEGTTISPSPSTGEGWGGGEVDIDRRINVFDWNDDEKGFGRIMKEGGFDCVIGNPPWGADFSENEKRYLEQHYLLNSGKYESYIYFIEKGTKLLNDKCLFGFIVPSYWISRSQTEHLRQYLTEDMTPESFIVLPENVFSGVKMDSAIIVARKDGKSDTCDKFVLVGEISSSQLIECFKPMGIDNLLEKIILGTWQKHPRFRFNPRISKEDSKIILKVEKNTFDLGAIVEISQGLTLYRRSTLAALHGKAKAEEIVTKRLFHAECKKDDTYKKELLGRDVSRYSVAWNKKNWVSYGPWLAHAVDERFFKGPRLVVQKLRNPMLKQRLVAGYLNDDETYSAGVLLNIVPIKNETYSLMYILGLVNSSLLNYWYRKIILDVSIRVIDLKQLPIHTINFKNPKEKSMHDKMVSLVDRMLELNGKLRKAKTPHEKELFERQVKITDNQIDRLVYEFYGLTEEEIKVVEGR